MAIFEGTPLEPAVTEESDNTPDLSELAGLTDAAKQDAPTVERNGLLPVIIVVVVVALGVGAVLIIKRRR